MAKNISDLRNSLFETMQLLKEGKIDVSQAKAIADLGQVIVNTSKVENDFLNKQGGRGSGFIPLFQDNQSGKLERPKAEYDNSGYNKLLDKYAPIS